MSLRAVEGSLNAALTYVAGQPANALLVAVATKSDAMLAALAALNIPHVKDLAGMSSLDAYRALLPPNHFVGQNSPILLGIACAPASAQRMPSSIGSVRC